MKIIVTRRDPRLNCFRFVCYPFLLISTRYSFFRKDRHDTYVTLVFFFRSPLNYQGAAGIDENFDMDIPNIDIVDQIDVRQILGLSEEQWPPDQGNNF